MRRNLAAEASIGVQAADCGVAAALACRALPAPPPAKHSSVRVGLLRCADTAMPDVSIAPATILSFAASLAAKEQAAARPAALMKTSPAHTVEE